MEKLVELYNSDKYHIEFLGEIANYIDVNLIELYIKVLLLSEEAPFNEEINESYELSLMFLCKSLGFRFKKDGSIYYKEVNKNE